MAERADPRAPGFQDRRWGPFVVARSPYKRRLYERYRRCLPEVCAKRVLDIPCGTGWGTSLLKGAREVIGVDRDASAVRFAREHLGVEAYVGDMTHIPFPDARFDVVVCLEGLEHVSPEEGAVFLEEAARVLGPGGVLLMTCPIVGPDGEGTGNPYHLHEYRRNELRALTLPLFRIERFKRIEGPDGPEIWLRGRVRHESERRRLGAARVETAVTAEALGPRA